MPCFHSELPLFYCMWHLKPCMPVCRHLMRNVGLCRSYALGVNGRGQKALKELDAWDRVNAWYCEAQLPSHVLRRQTPGFQCAVDSSVASDAWPFASPSRSAADVNGAMDVKPDGTYSIRESSYKKYITKVTNAKGVHGRARQCFACNQERLIEVCRSHRCQCC